jgi:RecB family exonuclease
VPDAAQIHSFVEDAVEWRRSGGERTLRRLIRSSCSGVGHDVGAAYATLAERSGALLDAIDRGRLALPAAERDSVLQFSQRARRVRSIPQDSNDQDLRMLIAETFEVLSVAGRCAQPEVESAEAAAEIELADPVEPEPRRGIPPWQRHFSASALNAYAECARKWFYRYACAAVEDRGSSASAYGTALHLALEDFHADFPRPASRDQAAMRHRIRQCVTWAFERNRDGFETTVEFELQVRRAQRTAQRYVDWLLVQEKEAPFEVLGREVATNLDLEGRMFVGFIDRLDRDERSGDIRVVDYKTGSIAQSAGEYCDKVRRFRDFQLPFYYWARTAAGDRVTKLALIPLKDALLDVRPIVLEVAADSARRSRDNGAPAGTIGLDELKRSRARMVELSDRLASGEIRDFEPTQDAAACTYCNYATACWRKPPTEGRRFGS